MLNISIWNISRVFFPTNRFWNISSVSCWIRRCNYLAGLMIQDAIAGKIWTQDDLLQWYETALAEEAERRRAAKSENED